MINKRITYIFIFALLFVGCTATKNNVSSELYNYKPDSQELYNTIIQLDSIFFEAYNTCNLNKQAEIYSDSIEFYHDKTGLTTSKQSIIESTKKNICGKVTRELVKGSIEVYPVNGYGAVEIGLHRFHNNTEKESNEASGPSKFIIIWQHQNSGWKISRVVSLH